MIQLNAKQSAVLRWLHAAGRPVTSAYLSANKPGSCLFTSSDIGKALQFLRTNGLVQMNDESGETLWSVAEAKDSE